MTSCTDYLNLNEQQLFKTVRETLPKGLTKTENVLTVRDEVIYVWNAQDNCVLTSNLKTNKNPSRQAVNYQTLLPTSPPLFSPEVLTVNSVSTLLAVAGPHGVLVLELPARTPPYGTFSSGKEIIYCRSYSMDERLLSTGSTSEVRQIRWHPGSPNENHLLVLTSDNNLRLYSINNNQAINEAVYPIGKQPISILPGSRVPFLSALGETAVDFDFGPPQLPEKCNASKGKWLDLLWPIYILRGDGDVYMIICALNDKTKPIRKGPLCMYPSADDNYGVDACSLMCFPTSPPVLVIATCTGTIFHCLVLDNDRDLDDAASENANSKQVASKGLYVFERIDIELGLALGDSDESYCCPVFLHKDDSNESRYFCTHETGVHAVTMPIVEQLGGFLASNDDNYDLQTLSQPSSAEYLLCTKASAGASVNPVVGFSLSPSPTSIIVLLANGHVVSLPLVSILLPKIEQLSLEQCENLTSPFKKMLKEPFDARIQKILKQGISQPIMKLSANSDYTLQDCYDLLMRATQSFREDRFTRLDNAREEIVKRVKTLQMLKDMQCNELKQLNEEKQSLQEDAERLAEKYEDIKDKQEELSKRCENLLILVTQKQPKPSEAEKELIKDLKSAEKKIQAYEKAIEKVKQRLSYQRVQMDNFKHQSESKKNTQLGSNQAASIRVNLEEMTKQITEMVKEIHKHRESLDLK